MDFYNFILITGHRLEEKNVCNLPLSNPQVVLYSSVLLAEIFAIYSAVLIFAKALKLKKKKKFATQPGFKLRNLKHFCHLHRTNRGFNCSHRCCQCPANKPPDSNKYLFYISIKHEVANNVRHGVISDTGTCLYNSVILLMFKLGEEVNLACIPRC